MLIRKEGFCVFLTSTAVITKSRAGKVLTFSLTVSKKNLRTRPNIISPVCFSVRLLQFESPFDSVVISVFLCLCRFDETDQELKEAEQKFQVHKLNFAETNPQIENYFDQCAVVYIANLKILCAKSLVIRRSVESWRDQGSC